MLMNDGSLSHHEGSENQPANQLGSKQVTERTAQEQNHDIRCSDKVGTECRSLNVMGKADTLFALSMNGVVRRSLFAVDAKVNLT
jgi:hypothetical protein